VSRRGSESGSATPLGAGEFAALLAALGPFERAPVIAVAVSGGADSMALCLLAAGWARRRRGRAVALTVDHGLRPGSGREARQVGAWLGARGIEHHILRWRGEKPARGVQAAARAARYGLLGAWCRRRRILHLLLAHHLEDQAETLLGRLGRGSGLDGLAAMAALGESHGLRLVRPLLGVPRARLGATLERRRQDWIEDPANRDPAYLRVRLRRALEVLAPEGLSPGRLAATAGRLGRARAALEAEVSELLARAVTIHPAGFCHLDPALLAAAPAEVGLRALARTLTCVGGASYTPRLERLERLFDAVVSNAPAPARTLAGCRVAAAAGKLLICREAAAAGEVLAVPPGRAALWDRRFEVRLAPAAAAWGGRLEVHRLGRAGWSQVVAQRGDLRQNPIPAAARPSLPSLWDVDGVLSVPHLQFARPGSGAGEGHRLDAVFRPAHPLSPATFAVGWRPGRVSG
jgi:tRNA(Ile)-lysidine synthase